MIYPYPDVYLFLCRASIFQIPKPKVPLLDIPASPRPPSHCVSFCPHILFHFSAGNFLG